MKKLILGLVVLLSLWSMACASTYSSRWKIENLPKQNGAVVYFKHKVQGSTLTYYTLFRGSALRTDPEGAKGIYLEEVSNIFLANPEINRVILKGMYSKSDDYGNIIYWLVIIKCDATRATFNKCVTLRSDTWNAHYRKLLWKNYKGWLWNPYKTSLEKACRLYEKVYK